MKREWIESTFVFLMFLAILLVVGFFNFSTLHIKPISELALNEIERIDLPFDLNRFPNSVLNCKAKNNQITVATLKAAAELKVKRSTPIEKILEKQHITGKQGVINLPADCSIKAEGLTINKDDILIGEGFLQDTPGLINENSKKIKNNTLIIYNTSFNDTEFKVESFLEDGTKALEKSFKVKSFSFKILKTKDNTAKTYRITPQSEGASYFALNRASISGKVYISKPLRTFSNAIISPKKGVLVVSNVTSAPATFRYIVTKNGEKRYEGKEWLLPYSQRKISLAKLKSLKNAKMEITPISYYYPKFCNEDGKCFRDESKKDNNIVASYYNGKAFSAITNTDETFSDEIRYTNKVDKALPVSCKIDNVVKPYCDKDSNGNGIDDAEELFHYFANPEMEDADNDGFSNREEIEAGTKAFHPFDFPGAPKDDTVEGMYQVARMIENHNFNVKSLQKGIYDFNTREELVANSQIENLINSYNYYNYNLTNNLLNSVCDGLKICIEKSQYSDKIATYVDGCLNVMNQMAGRVVNRKGRVCRYCKTDILIADKSDCKDRDLWIESGDGFKDGRSFYQPSEHLVQLNPFDLENRPLYTICHELGHAYFSIDDRYAESDFDIPSLYSGHSSYTKCLTSYDIYILELASYHQMTGKPLSEIISSTAVCSTGNGKKGVFFPFSFNCIENWTTDEYKKNPRLYCPPNGQNSLDPEFPKSPFEKECHCHTVRKKDNEQRNDKKKQKDDENLCCENEDDIDCGGDCCPSNKCVDGVCNTSTCSPFEVEATIDVGPDLSLEICCPHIRALYDKKRKEMRCCLKNTVACGDSCCDRRSCLESAEGQFCCPSQRPYACLNAVGSVDGCCERGCLGGSDDVNRMCMCGADEYPVTVPDEKLAGKSVYLGCCKNGQFFQYSKLSRGNSLKCLDKCPENMKPTENRECKCPQSSTCGKNCCGSDEVCRSLVAHLDGQLLMTKKCFKCSGKKVGSTCQCQDGRIECFDGVDVTCCPKGEQCVNGSCSACPKGSYMVQGHLGKCYCEDTGEEVCGSECCSKYEICVESEKNGVRSSTCQRCPKGMINKSGKCVCGGDGEEPCGSEQRCCPDGEFCARLDADDKGVCHGVCSDGRRRCESFAFATCCSADQVCRYLQNPSGAKSGQCVAAVCEDGRKRCNGECCSKDKSCIGNKCQDPKVDPEAVLPINGNCPEGYKFYNNIYQICCPKGITLGAGVDANTGEYRCFRDAIPEPLDPNV